jgi:hypothetical protein
VYASEVLLPYTLSLFFLSSDRLPRGPRSVQSKCVSFKAISLYQNIKQFIVIGSGHVRRNESRSRSRISSTKMNDGNRKHERKQEGDKNKKMLILSSRSEAAASVPRDEDFDVTQQLPPPPSFTFASAPNPGVFPRFADHTYRDYAAYIDEGGKIQRHKKSDRNFPAHLHVILSNERYSHVISWMVSRWCFPIVPLCLCREHGIGMYSYRDPFTLN